MVASVPELPIVKSGVVGGEESVAGFIATASANENSEFRIFADKFRITASAIFNKSESGGLFVANEDLEISTALAESGTQNYQAYSFSADYDFSFASLNVSGTYYNNESTQIQDLNTLLPTVNYILGLG